MAAMDAALAGIMDDFRVQIAPKLAAAALEQQQAKLTHMTRRLEQREKDLKLREEEVAERERAVEQREKAVYHAAIGYPSMQPPAATRDLTTAPPQPEVKSPSKPVQLLPARSELMHSHGVKVAAETPQIAAILASMPTPTRNEALAATAGSQSPWKQTVHDATADVQAPTTKPTSAPLRLEKADEDAPPAAPAINSPSGLRNQGLSKKLTKLFEQKVSAHTQGVSPAKIAAPTVIRRSSWCRMDPPLESTGVEERTRRTTQPVAGEKVSLQVLLAREAEGLRQA